MVRVLKYAVLVLAVVVAVAVASNLQSPEERSKPTLRPSPITYNEVSNSPNLGKSKFVQVENESGNLGQWSPYFSGK